MKTRKSNRGIQASAWKQRKSSFAVNPIQLLVGCMGLLALIGFIVTTRIIRQQTLVDVPPDVPVPATPQRVMVQEPVVQSQNLRSSTTTKTISNSLFVNDLIQLARMPTSDLRQKLEQDDYFQINQLVDACPFDINNKPPSWLPPAPILPDASSSSPFLWYEHLSKAGGTAFCSLAQRNMPRAQIAPYYCMPRDEEDVPNDPDGRVGRWSNAKLQRYRMKHKAIRLVSNEWQPFPKERLELPNILLLTTLRNPLDRLLSAYHFWGWTHNQAVVKPTLAQWLQRQLKRSFGKDPQAWPFAVHIGRYNFITWKFSNGTMPQGIMTRPFDTALPASVTRESESEWLLPLTQAAENLARFHLVMILELMDHQSSQLLTRTLPQWTDLKNSQVVPSGKVQNNHAKGSDLSDEEYDLLWEANRFDMILYYWMKAVHLCRLQCS